MNRKKIFSAVFIFVIIIAVLIFGVNRYTASREKIEQEYLNSFNLRFSGVVTGKVEVESFTGILFVDVKSTSVVQYDVRDSSKVYYCVLKNGKAEIVETMDKAEVGDSIVVDGPTKKLKVFRNRKQVAETKIWVGNFEPFIAKLKAEHRL